MNNIVSYSYRPGFFYLFFFFFVHGFPLMAVRYYIVRRAVTFRSHIFVRYDRLYRVGINRDFFFFFFVTSVKNLANRRRYLERFVFVLFFFFPRLPAVMRKYSISIREKKYRNSFFDRSYSTVVVGFLLYFSFTTV